MAPPPLLGPRVWLWFLLLFLLQHRLDTGSNPLRPLDAQGPLLPPRRGVLRLDTGRNLTCPCRGHLHLLPPSCHLHLQKQELPSSRTPRSDEEGRRKERRREGPNRLEQALPQRHCHCHPNIPTACRPGARNAHPDMTTADLRTGKKMPRSEAEGRREEGLNRLGQALPVP